MVGELHRAGQPSRFRMVPSGNMVTVSGYHLSIHCDDPNYLEWRNGIYNAFGQFNVCNTVYNTPLLFDISTG